MRRAIGLVVTFLLTAGTSGAQELWPGTTYDPGIPTIKSVLGHDFGDEVSAPEEIAIYLRRWRPLARARGWSRESPAPGGPALNVRHRLAVAHHPARSVKRISAPADRHALERLPTLLVASCRWDLADATPFTATRSPRTPRGRGVPLLAALATLWCTRFFAIRRV